MKHGSGNLEQWRVFLTVPTACLTHTTRLLKDLNPHKRIPPQAVAIFSKNPVYESPVEGPSESCFSTRSFSVGCPHVTLLYWLIVSRTRCRRFIMHCLKMYFTIIIATEFCSYDHSPSPFNTKCLSSGHPSQSSRKTNCSRPSKECWRTENR